MISHRKALTNRFVPDSYVGEVVKSGPLPMVPVLILSPEGVTEADTSKSNVGAIVGGVAGAITLVTVIVAVVCLCLLRARSRSNRHSDTGSSDRSVPLDRGKGPESPLIGHDLSRISQSQRARQFTISQLEHATKNWSTHHLIGDGGFGLVYKGLLEDGTIVAIKKRTSTASQEFANEVEYLSRIRHRHLVILIGYCQENEQQMVVYDYLPNGSVSSHLYDADGNPLGKLDFKQRLSIALGAAKGLEHLHSLRPPLVHRDFKTSNVLVDENFVPKVTDYGLSRLISSPDGAGTAGFLDPEFFSSHNLNEKSDVFSFGVFLLELISGREAISTYKPRSEWSLVQWARTLLEQRNLAALVDVTMVGNFMEDSMKSLMEVAFQCIEPFGNNRPMMEVVVTKLAHILKAERGLTSTLGEGTSKVVLGSELFT